MTLRFFASLFSNWSSFDYTFVKKGVFPLAFQIFREAEVNTKAQICTTGEALVFAGASCTEVVFSGLWPNLTTKYTFWPWPLIEPNIPFVYRIFATSDKLGERGDGKAKKLKEGVGQGRGSYYEDLPSCNGKYQMLGKN